MFDSSENHEIPLMSDYREDTNTASQFTTKSSTRLTRRLKFSTFTTIVPWLLCCFLSIWICWLYQPRFQTTNPFPLLTYCMPRQNNTHFEEVTLIFEAPVHHLLEYEIRKFQLGLGVETTEYQGEPSPELDKSWDSLYSMGVSKIPLEEARKLPNLTVIFPHDKQRHYIIELDVFHQLHCLNMIRKALRPDYYNHTMPGDDGEDELLGVHHIDHCVDAIRQSLMCTVDVSVLTWEWSEARQKHFEKATVLHTCRKFDQVRDWAREHMVSEPFDSGFQEHNDPLDPKTWLDGYHGE